MIIRSLPLRADRGKIAWMTNLSHGIIILLLTSIKCSKQGVISNRESVSVCPGGQLILSCSTNSSSLQWTVIVFPPSYFDPRESGIRSFYRIGSEIMHEQPIIINQTVFHFSKTSSLPLMSIVSVVNVTSDMNQTRVCCIHEEEMSETIIHVIGSDAIANPWPVSIADEQFGDNNVNVTLTWIQKEVIFSSIFPAADVRLIGNMSVQLTIPYNILHDVSVAVCGHSPTNVAELFYMTCKHPNESLAVINYTPPAVEGSNITIKCFIDDIRTNLTIDNRTSTCINGQWEPDLDQLLLEGCKDVASFTETRERTITTAELINEATDDLDRTVILGGSLGASLLILVAGIIILFIVILTKKSSLCSHKPSQNSPLQRSNQQITHNKLGNQYLGEYSEITLQSQSQDAGGMQPRTLVYADLGPLSFEKRKPFSSPSILDDNRIEYAQLNTRLSAKEVQQTKVHQENFTNIALDLDSLLIQLQPEVTEKWYQFGEAIGVGRNILDKYVSYPPDQNIIEVCDYWLRNHTGQPTWNEVAAALKQIGFQQLACDIAKVYKTGKLPKEVNMNAVNMESDLLVDEDEEPPPIPPRLI